MPHSDPPPPRCVPLPHVQERDAECAVTGYKHRVMCLKSTEKKFVACDPAAEDTRQETLKFWVFQVCCLVPALSHRGWQDMRRGVMLEKRFIATSGYRVGEST